MLYDDFIKSDIALEYAMLQVEEFVNGFIVCEATEDKHKEPTPAQRRTFKQKITAMIDAFKEFMRKLVTKIKTKILTKGIDKEFEQAKAVAKLVDENEGGKCEIPDHTEEYKDIEYTRQQLKMIEKKLKKAEPVTEDEVRGIMEEYRKRRLAHCHGGKKTGSYGWGVSGVIGNANALRSSLTANVVGPMAALNNGNLALSVFNLGVAAETIRAGILLDKEEAELKTRDLSECVRFIKDLNAHGMKIYPETMENLVKTPRNKVDRFFTC